MANGMMLNPLAQESYDISQARNKNLEEVRKGLISPLLKKIGYESPEDKIGNIKAGVNWEDRNSIQGAVKQLILADPSGRTAAQFLKDNEQVIKMFEQKQPDWSSMNARNTFQKNELNKQAISFIDSVGGYPDVNNIPALKNFQKKLEANKFTGTDPHKWVMSALQKAYETRNIGSPKADAVNVVGEQLDQDLDVGSGIDFDANLSTKFPNADANMKARLDNFAKDKQGFSTWVIQYADQQNVPTANVIEAIKQGKLNPLAPKAWGEISGEFQPIENIFSSGR
jgi:hypothetical protein